MESFSENIFDGKTLADSLVQVKTVLGSSPGFAYVDRGYRGRMFQISWDPSKGSMTQQCLIRNLKKVTKTKDLRSAEIVLLNFEKRRTYL